MQSGSALITLIELSASSSDALLRLATRAPIRGRRPPPASPRLRSPLSKRAASALARARDTAVSSPRLLLPPSKSRSVRPAWSKGKGVESAGFEGGWLEHTRQRLGAQCLERAARSY